MEKTLTEKKYKYVVIILPVFALIALFGTPCPAWVNPQADIALKGNKLYEQGEYDQALEKYGQALIELPDNPILHFNMGNTAYKKEDYAQAEASYAKALAVGDSSLEARAGYNMGNCKYQQGRLKENTNLQEAIQLYRQALDYYKKAIELESSDKDAKFNHEFVERRMKELISKANQEQKDQQKDQQNQQGRQRQQEDSESQKDQEKKQEEKQGQEQEEQSAQEKEQEKQEGQEAQEQDADGEDPEAEKTEMSEKEALTLLDSLRDEELDQLDRRPDRQGREQRYKDW